MERMAIQLQLAIGIATATATAKIRVHHDTIPVDLQYHGPREGVRASLQVRATAKTTVAKTNQHCQ
jgi:hypothetical protein